MSQKLGGGGRKHDQLPEKAESPTKNPLASLKELP